MDDIPRTRIIIIEAQSDLVVTQVLRELSSTGRVQHDAARKAKRMGDTYIISQAGAVGPDARSVGNSFLQAPGRFTDIDLTLLTQQLEIVRAKMRNEIVRRPALRRRREVHHVTRAWNAARQSDTSKAVSHLKKTGNWTLNVAKEVGAEVVALTLAHLLGC